MASQAPFVLTAHRIVAEQARMNVLGNTLTFRAAAIDGMCITRAGDGLTLRIRSDGRATVGETKIQATVLRNLASIGSFRSKRDVLVLLAGGSIPKLELSRVELVIDGYLVTSYAEIPGMRLEVV
ncbi:hypothetical protein [Alicyclobacillus vulcanalis]|uniref:Uncharacterized protein n=1 Tax=Alicyclobacillus vulcanalis TaxID=252246 RepID=A0A1N7MGU2_9BACL|nr:hypothetical protein [Alicyclobacillus vulcanalis]SIS85211.1 hypothetical protein SAMN05421799_105133 [Alicyclobacillus vulcanalis]